TGVFQPAVDEALGEIAQAAVLEIHGHEGYIAHDVDPAEGVIELYAVEKSHLSGDKGDVIQVDVTMAFTHQPLGLALCQLGNQPLEGSMRPLLKLLELCQVG